MKHPYIYPTRKPEPMITRTMLVMLAGVILAGPVAFLVCRIVETVKNLH